MDSMMVIPLVSLLDANGGSGVGANIPVRQDRIYSEDQLGRSPDAADDLIGDSVGQPGMIVGSDPVAENTHFIT
jgi:hypothetical protein